MECSSLFPCCRTLSVPACIQTLAGMGHDFNLHLNHEEGWRLIDEWIRANLPAK
jgi:hypothetical protein